VLSSWIALQGQTLASRQDSMICYTPSEMGIISTKLIEGNECSALLKVYKAAGIQKDTTIASLERSLTLEGNRHRSTKRLAREYEVERDRARDELNTANTQKKWLKAGWAGTAVLLAITTILALIH